MARPPIPVGSYGKITTLPVTAGQFEARCRFRDYDGVTRLVGRQGKTKTAAENNLKAALRERQGRPGTQINGDTRLSDLGKAWLAEIKADEDMATGTKQLYSYVLNSYIESAVGALRIREATVEHLDRALVTIRERHGRASAKSTRTVLSGMLGYAARRGAINTNPIKYTSSIRRGRNNTNRPRALTPQETHEVLTSLRGMKRAVDLDLPDLVTLMLGTGCRIGEACAMRKAFNAEGKQLLDLEAGTWEVNATVIRVQGVRRLAELQAKGRLNWEEQEELAVLLKYPPGLHVQERPKTGAGWRRIALPPSVVEMLRRRKNELRLRGPVEVTFGSPRARALRDPSNTPGDLREVLNAIACDTCGGTARLPGKAGRTRRCPDAGPYAWVHSHTFRKTVATRLEEAGCTPRQVADQLGQANPSMTLEVYFGQEVVTTRAAQILDMANAA
jgi:integrase